jgi:hypothetical protein
MNVPVFLDGHSLPFWHCSFDSINCHLAGTDIQQTYSFFFAPVNMLKSQGTVHIIAAITTPEEIVLEKCWTEMLHVMCDGCFQWCFLNADSRTHILAHHLVSCMYLVLSTCKNLPGNQVGLLLWTCRKARPGYKYEMTDTFMNYIHEVYGNGQNISQQPTCSDPLHF